MELLRTERLVGLAMVVSFLFGAAAFLAGGITILIGCSTIAGPRRTQKLYAPGEIQLSVSQGCLCPHGRGWHPSRASRGSPLLLALHRAGTGYRLRRRYR